ncbi:MAG: glycosyltransferase family 4 protein [Candidatus Nitrospinota bacterium M3_3B_026]
MSKRLRILTFNWHEPYIWLLSKTGHRFDVAEPSLGREGIRRWDGRVRPVPQNARVIGMETARESLRDGAYDLALCHNFMDLKEISSHPVPAVLLFHNKLTTELALGGDTVSREKYLAGVAALAQRADEMVFVSESKMADWGFGRGKVIKPGVDIDDLLSYEGHERKVLRVGNYMKERDIMLGYFMQERAVEGFESTIAGVNPTLPGARLAESFEALAGFYASHRVYLNTTLAPYEDGYNLAMLEAMGAGQPVISCKNPTSPIENGVNGLISSSMDGMRAAIAALMENRDSAANLGRRGKETVMELFGMEKFKARWEDVFETVAGG